jgi:hypothetical protein
MKAKFNLVFLYFPYLNAHSVLLGNKPICRLSIPKYKQRKWRPKKNNRNKWRLEHNIKGLVSKEYYATFRECVDRLVKIVSDFLGQFYLDDFDICVLFNRPIKKDDLRFRKIKGYICECKHKR